MTADHLEPLVDGWTVWRTICVRGSGFPATGVHALAAPEVATLADRVVSADTNFAAVRTRVIAACEAAIAVLPDERGNPYRGALKQLRLGRPVPSIATGSALASDATAEVTAVLGELATAERELAELRAAFADLLHASSARASDALRAVARDDRFREAVLWQNSRFLRIGVEALLRRPEGANDSKTRQYEMTLASYLQRYCLKSESIGFFGPIGWGTFADRTHLEPGPTLLAERTVYFEHWGIARLAARLAEDPALRPTLAPRRMPTLRVTGTTLHLPIDRTAELPPAYARLLAACDGDRSARAIAEELCADPALELAGVDEVYELLAELVERKFATWTCEVPAGTAFPERTLRALLEQADAAPRATAIAALDRLEACRTRIELIARTGPRDPARGHEVDLDRAFTELETTFTALTYTAGTRRAGETYAGRSLVYEDCRRDVELGLGPEQREPLGRALAPLLQSARWYTFAIAERYQAILVEAYRALRTERSSSVIDYIRFWERIEPHFGGNPRAPAPIVRDVVAELHRRWMAVLGGPFTGSRVEHTGDHIRAAAQLAFAAPHPGWPSARHHSPDVIIAARSIEAMRAGEATYVLGELHVGINSLVQSLFFNQHPRPQYLIDCMEADLPSPGLDPVIPYDRIGRAHDASIASIDFDLETGHARSRRARSHVVAAGELVVEEIAGRLCVRTRDGLREFDAIAFFDHFFRVESVAHFTLLPPLLHTPRITIERLVVSRERWTFAAETLAFAHRDSAADRFLEVRRWAHEHALPRLLFFKVPEETKPCFLDLESPSYVELFCKLVRKAKLLHLSEMLPVIDDAWLADAEGQRYASELRIATLDPEPWRPK